jgi:hypothetical protein
MDPAPDWNEITPQKVVFECSVAAQGIVRATVADLGTLREEPGAAASLPVPPRFLRHADEQTVVGLAAVLRAIRDPALQNERFGDWGVLAATQFAGRVVGAAALNKYSRDGAATVSPHIIPQHSLHSLAAAVSVVLGLHGPSFGVGGGSEAITEGLTAALTFLDQDTLPGLWVVLTGWDPEPVPDGMGSSELESICRGVALALVPRATDEPMLRLTIPQPFHTAQDSAGLSGTFTLTELIGRLTSSAEQQPGLPWSCILSWGGQIELTTGRTRLGKAA